LSRHEGFGGINPIPSGFSSLDRFVRAAHLAQSYDNSDPVSYGFLIQEQVKLNGQWQIFYDLSGKIHYKTTFSPGRKQISMESINFSCRENSLAQDINAPDVQGPVNLRFQALTPEINDYLIGHNGEFPDYLMAILSAYPWDHTHCVE
jgi:hypothetical protein